MVHQQTRWLVLAAVAVRTGVALHGLATARTPGGPDRRGSLVALILTDLQLTMGLALWAFVSPVVATGRADVGAAMKDGSVRWALVEHPLMMVVAVVLIHVGQVLTKRAREPQGHRRLAAVYGLALLLLLAGSFRHG